MDSETNAPIPSVSASNDFQASIKFSTLLPSPGFTNKYDPEGEYIAIGCNNGEKLLFSVAESTYSQNTDKIIEKVEDETETPVTCIRWRPTVNSKTKVIGVGIADGRFEYWHVPTMKKMFSITETDNSILCCDFDKTGEKFATAGKDCTIRVYDEQTKSISSLLGRAEWNYSGHSNRIFSIKFIDENTIISGGWDSVIHIWDLRLAKSIKSFYGPHLAGDSLDFVDNTILTGCYASKDQIQLWDYRNFQPIESINWPCEKDEVSYVYTACFGNQDRNTIIAGASGVNEVRVFTGSSKHTTSVRIYGLNQGCYSVDSKRSGLCFSTSKQGFYICGYSNNKE